MMKTALYAILLLLFPLGLSAQGGLRQQVAKKQTVPAGNVEKKAPVRKPTTVAPKPKNDPDTVYCIATKKQHGWFAPLYTVDKEFAMHHGQHYRFTRRNVAGHWTKMEVLDGYGQLKPNNGMTPYILNVNAAGYDKKINKDWLEKVKTECIYEFIAGPTGEDIVQERAYDMDMNLVYSYSRVQIGKPEERKFLGSYRDCFGLPAEMRDDPEYVYGTLVIITEDQWGNDSIIQYVDSKLVPKNNSWGVAQQHFIQDKYGHQLLNVSCDINGKRVKDLAGNCAWQSEWDTIRHVVITHTCLDENLRPMRMPNQLGRGSSESGSIKMVTKYDEYLREIEFIFFDSENKPDTNMWGTHRQQISYDKHGNILLYTGYDLNGNLSPIEGSESCEVLFKYDDKGREISGVFLDRERKSAHKEGYISRREAQYDDDGSLCKQVYWSAESGKEDTCYYYCKTKDSYYEIMWDGTCKIDSLDAKGRNILTAYYNADGKPMVNSNEGYHCKRTMYISEEGSETTLIYYFDSELNTIGAWIGITDSLTARQTVFGNNQSYIMQYDDSLKTVIANYDCNGFGNICRAGGLNGDCRLYSIDINRSQKGNSNFFTARDEFGEPDYMVADNGVIYYYAKTNKNGYVVPFDEHSNPIESYSTFKNKCHKAISVEVTDSTAYKLGLLDNDVILKYGSYIMLTDTLSYRQFLTDWTLKGILDAKKERDMVVFRVNPETKEYGLHIIENLMGTPSELGFIPHVRYLTTRQYDRILKTVESHEATAKKSVISLNEMNKHKKENAYKDIIISFPEAFGNSRNMSYMTTVKEPALLLGVKTSKGDAYLYGQNPAKFSAVLNSFNKGEDKIEYVLATNMEGVKSYTLEEKFAGANWINAEISSSDYKKFRKLAEEVEKGFNMRSTKESNDSICPVSLIVSRVEFDGLARSAGLEGDFAVFEYNEWNMERGLDGIGDVITKGKEMKKHLIFAPIFLDNAGYIDHFGEPAEYNLDEGMLGMRIFDMSVMQSQYNEALNIYKKYKKKHKNKK